MWSLIKFCAWWAFRATPPQRCYYVHSVFIIYVEFLADLMGKGVIRRESHVTRVLLALVDWTKLKLDAWQDRVINSSPMKAS